MIDLKLIRENPGFIREELRKRSTLIDLDKIVALDVDKRDLLKETEQLKHERNVTSEKIGLLKKRMETADKETLIMRDVSKRIKELDSRVRLITSQLEKELLMLPNILNESVPQGTSNAENVEVKKWGEPKEFRFNPKSHQELGESLGLLDFGRGTKLSGSGFVLYTGYGARIERALINFMLDLHIRKHNYVEVSPPFMVKSECCITTGNLPKFADDLYRIEDSSFYLIPTAEVPLTNIHKKEILEEKRLPIKYVSYTPCFRREAGSWGQDTKGLMRQHQFDKVELVKFVTQEESYNELELLLSEAEEILKVLDLPYRVVQLCAGDIGFSSAKTYDIEVWIPSQKKYREISSCSNYEDFQARRGEIKYRAEKGGKPRLAHTLNGSALAIGRTLVAILENYQEADGSLVIPEVLRPYMGGMEKIGINMEN